MEQDNRIDIFRQIDRMLTYATRAKYAKDREDKRNLSIKDPLWPANDEHDKKLEELEAYLNPRGIPTGLFVAWTDDYGYVIKAD